MSREDKTTKINPFSLSLIFGGFISLLIIASVLIVPGPGQAPKLNLSYSTIKKTETPLSDILNHSDLITPTLIPYTSSPIPEKNITSDRKPTPEYTKTSILEVTRIPINTPLPLIETSTPTLTTSPTPTVIFIPTATPEPKPKFIIHIFESDDILWKLAEKYGVTTQEIIELNPEIDPDFIIDGTEIKIPVK